MLRFRLRAPSRGLLPGSNWANLLPSGKKRWAPRFASFLRDEVGRVRARIPTPGRAVGGITGKTYLIKSGANLKKKKKKEKDQNDLPIYQPGAPFPSPYISVLSHHHGRGKPDFFHGSQTLRLQRFASFILHCGFHILTRNMVASKIPTLGGHRFQTM